MRCRSDRRQQCFSKRSLCGSPDVPHVSLGWIGLTPFVSLYVCRFVCLSRVFIVTLSHSACFPISSLPCPSSLSCPLSICRRLLSVSPPPVLSRLFILSSFSLSLHLSLSRVVSLYAAFYSLTPPPSSLIFILLSHFL